MPDFVCDVCDVIENTACGFYWGRNHDKIWWKNSDLQGKALCSQCAPARYIDGSENGYGGKWHGKFERVIATEEILLERKDGTRELGFGRRQVDITQSTIRYP